MHCANFTNCVEFGFCEEAPPPLEPAVDPGPPDEPPQPAIAAVRASAAVAANARPLHNARPEGGLELIRARTVRFVIMLRRLLDRCHAHQGRLYASAGHATVIETVTRL
jgi:hypothetical protein